MKRSLMSRFGLMAAVACIAAASMAADVVSLAVSAVYRVRDAVCDLFLHAASLAPAKAEVVNPVPVVRLLAAKQFVLRAIKREVPRIEGNWRACPSV